MCREPATRIWFVALLVLLAVACTPLVASGQTQPASGPPGVEAAVDICDADPDHPDCVDICERFPRSPLCFAPSPLGEIVEDLRAMSEGGAFGIVLLALIVLPVPVSLARMVAGAREAWLALAIAVGMWLVWWAFYATEWFENAGLGAVLYLVGLSALAWVVLVAQPAIRTARRALR